LHLIERHLRVNLQWQSVADALVLLQGKVLATPEFALDMMDFLLQMTEADLANDLEHILSQGGSAWRVSASRDSLERRVSAEAAARAAELTTGGTRAGDHLRNAWHSTYGRSPNPSEAYREAVKAVEAAAIPIVCPNDQVATLGKMLGQMRATQDKWRIALKPMQGTAVADLLGMLELLWTAQLDRHGTADPEAPLSVSQGEAEAAVHLALTLVHWFQAGLVRPA
jgi:hypothetical protein